MKTSIRPPPSKERKGLGRRRAKRQEEEDARCAWICPGFQYYFAGGGRVHEGYAFDLPVISLDSNGRAFTKEKHSSSVLSNSQPPSDDDTTVLNQYTVKDLSKSEFMNPKTTTSILIM